MEARQRIAVVGLGYVGLPVAVAFGKLGPVIGFDINKAKIEDFRRGEDRTGEVSKADLLQAHITFTDDPSALKSADSIIVAVPTPINAALQPDLTALKRASELIGTHLKAGTIVVYESTVYPGATEEICGPILERCSGLRCGKDFKLGYSPERINPGDKEHTFERVVKVVAGMDADTLEAVAQTYAKVVTAGVHRAPSIKVAEAAKVIENTQRDLNIALMNELTLIFHRLGIDTAAVLEAAGTKWNFLRFTPGLVGGHCIGVDPYYLTTKAESVGYHPQVILAGRRINNGMGVYVAEQTVKSLSRRGTPAAGARVAVLGLTFKEDVPDVRNSRVPDIVAELRQYGIEVMVHDPLVASADAERQYGIHLATWESLKDFDGIVLAVPHRAYREMGNATLLRILKGNGGIVMDVKGLLDSNTLPPTISYWRL
ncbi:MAG: nucleotide sugar dehydrogenase [Nitrospiraceae bacterium]|nr:MAG: nucleotide sugar dehydrogenase [Nitrospiraceae bacterium]